MINRLNSDRRFISNAFCLLLFNVEKKSGSVWVCDERMTSEWNVYREESWNAAAKPHINRSHQSSVLNRGAAARTPWTRWPAARGTLWSNCATQLSIVILLWSDVMKEGRCWNLKSADWLAPALAASSLMEVGGYFAPLERFLVGRWIGLMRSWGLQTAARPWWVVLTW